MTKRALVVGINDYPGTGSDLYGCVNDAYDWRDALLARGFEISALYNDQAKRQNILTELKYLLGESSSGDLLVFTYSGHGTWVPSKDGDEPRDEAICPQDIFSSGPITDDELHALFSQRHRGVRVVMVADSCYSGTLQRLAGPLSDQPRYVRFLPPEAWMNQQAVQDGTLRAAANLDSLSVPKRKSLASGALVLAGCGENQVCYDASFKGPDGKPRANGAFTYAALQALAKLSNEGVNYRNWMRVIRMYLPSRDFDQKPQLDGLSYQKSWPVLEDGDE